MKNRRGMLMSLVAGAVALVLVVGSAIADEVMGYITKVDVEGKKLTVLSKEDEKDVTITVNADTKVIMKGEAIDVDLEKISKAVTKSLDAGKKGVFAKVTHEKGVASKIILGAGKKKQQ